MGNWLEHLLPPKEAEASSTTVLTEAFMQMDASLSTVQAMVTDYRAVCKDGALDAPWDAICTQCDEAIASYLSLVAPSAEPSHRAIERGTYLLNCARDEVNSFSYDNDRRLHDAVNEKIRRENDARQLRAAVARRATELSGEATKALSSVSTRLQAARSRQDDVPDAQSALLREFPWASCADVVEEYAHDANEALMCAADLLGRARAAESNKDPEEALALAQKARITLAEADRLIDAVPERLRVLNELRDNPHARSNKTRFALHDAQMFAVDHGLTKQWASVLDAQVKRIEALEASLVVPHPNYWAYSTDLGEVEKFIASVVSRMREAVRR